jgi:hypothetical protein
MKNHLKKYLANNKYIKAVYKAYKNTPPIYLDYALEFKPRWADEIGNPHLANIIESHKGTFQKNIDLLVEYKPVVEQVNSGKFPFQIRWNNGFIPAFDGLTLMWAAEKAKSTYMEIGSGNSTMFAKASILASAKNTKIISIDPFPRADIDTLCNEVKREPLEDLDISYFNQLVPGDTLFVDISHRSFMNSDVTTFMLDVLPLIPKGVLVGIHDIFLPYDYYDTWAERAYNEQYLLACYLLSNPNYFDIQLANYWVHKKNLHQIPLKGIWDILGDKIRDRASSSFWAIKK